MIDMNIFLSSMRAEMIPEGCSGLWFVKKLKIDEPKSGEKMGKRLLLNPGTYTYLYRLTNAILLHDPPGEVVMEDTPFELQTHLNFVIHAKGRVLVTGLGLGCVVRGLLANPAVDHVTCIENSKDVLKLVQPYMPVDRLTIIRADALEWTVDNKEWFDCAYHDLWSNEEEGEKKLQFLHLELLITCRSFAKYQDAWGFPRTIKHVMHKYGLLNQAV